jgi:hypothetical protein
MRNRSLAVLILLLAFGAAGSLNAMMVQLSPTDLSAQAQVIATGTVTGVTSQWDDSHSTIYSDVTVSVERVDKGDAANRTLTVRVPGGEVGDVGLAVEDMPKFMTGQKVTLNLIRSTDRAVFTLVGGGQGTTIAGKPPTQFYYSYSGYHRSPGSCYYYVNSSLPGDWLNAIRASGETWSTAGSAFRLYYEGTTDRTGPTSDGYNVVCTGHLGNGGTIAANYYWYNRKTKVVTENDIVFNSDLPWTTNGDPNAYDVQNICTHETGHDLVLDDLYKSYQSEMTMYGYGALGETKKQTLEFGDIDGIKAIYGTGLYQSGAGPVCIPVLPTH